MASLERLSNAVAQQEGDQAPKRRTIRDLIESQRNEIARALPAAAKATPDRLARVALTTIRTTPQLASCTPESLLGALMTTAQLGLEPGPLGHAYFVPFRNRKKVGNQWLDSLDVQFIVGYKGMIELARRAGTHVETWVIHEHDHFVFRRGTNAVMEYEPVLDGDPGRVIGYALFAQWKDGWYGRFMRLDEVERIRDRSKSWNPERPSGPWHTDFDAMARKSVVRAAFNANAIPMTVEIAQALNVDETVRTSYEPDALDEPRDDYLDAEEVTDEPAGAVGPGAGNADSRAVTDPLDDGVPVGEPFLDAGEAGEGGDPQVDGGDDGALDPAGLPDDVDTVDWLTSLTLNDIKALARRYGLAEPRSMTAKELRPLAAKVNEERAR